MREQKLLNPKLARRCAPLLCRIVPAKKSTLAESQLRQGVIENPSWPPGVRAASETIPAYWPVKVMLIVVPVLWKLVILVGRGPSMRKYFGVPAAVKVVEPPVSVPPAVLPHMPVGPSAWTGAVVKFGASAALAA